MFRIVKVLNNNGVLAISVENGNEVIVLGKGVGFGRKVNERIKTSEDAKIYELQSATERGDSHSLVMSIDPVYLEITNGILQEAYRHFESIDTDVFLPLADHIAFAVKRIQELGYINNPMNTDIMALFPTEYKVAEYARELIKNTVNVDFCDDELGYIALHIHSAVDDSKVSDLMKHAQIIHYCIDCIEQQMNVKLDQHSLAYNRLLSHMKYMIVRMIKGEEIALDMNVYIEHQYPETFKLAKDMCDYIGEQMKYEYKSEEIGYLAMHIERVCLKNTKL